MNMGNYSGCIIYAVIIYLTCHTVDDVNAGFTVGDYLSTNPFAGRSVFPSRSVRAPSFHVHEMSTARGYGKRNADYHTDGWEAHLYDQWLGSQGNKRGSSHGIDLREPRLRFRMESDSGLRIGRGFGKRSVGNGQKEEYTIPWSSPTIRELNEVQNVLKAALDAVQSETTTVSSSESESMT